MIARTAPFVGSCCHPVSFDTPLKSSCMKSRCQPAGLQMLPVALCEWQFEQQNVNLCHLFQQENVHTSCFHCSRHPISQHTAAF